MNAMESPMTTSTASSKSPSSSNTSISFYKGFNLSLSERESQLKQILKPFTSNEGDFSDEDLLLPANEVRAQWQAFLKTVLPNTAWMAVWKNGDQDVTKYVDIVNVDFDNLKASAILLENDDEKEDHEEEEVLNIPLLELYPIIEEEDSETGDAGTEITARALDNFRFFYRYIWKSWDDDGDEEDWPSEQLSERFALYQEFKQQGEMSHNWTKIQNLHLRYQELKDEKRMIEESQENLELEMSNDDVASLIEIEDQMSTIRNKYHLIQDPDLRMAVTVREQNKRRENRQGPGPAVHVVIPDGKQGGNLAELIEYLIKVKDAVDSNDLPANICSDVASAVGQAIQGDVIVLSKGDHVADDLGEICQGGTIMGMEEDVQLLSKVKYAEKDIENLELLNVSLIF